MERKPGLFAKVTLEVLTDTRLKPNEKLLFGLINSLATYEGYCFASNVYLSKYFKCDKKTITSWLSNLKENGYVKIIIEKDEKGLVTSRKIYPKLMSNEALELYQKSKGGIHQKAEGYPSNNGGVPIKQCGGPHQTMEYIRRDYKNNLLEENIYSPADAEPVGAIEEIISYLNERTGKNYRPGTKKYQQLIKARIKEGNTIDDFKKAIDNCCSRWLNNPKMNRYLRPDTIFNGEKFGGYVNDVPVTRRKEPRRYE